MIYLSKGVTCKDSSSHTVCYAGRTTRLSQIEKMLWEKGRYGITELTAPEEKTEVAKLIRLGLAECEVKNNASSRYWLWTRCFVCPAKKSYNFHRLQSDEQNIYTWLCCAGIRLTVAELIYLVEHEIKPTEDLLYAKNRQTLIERIYTAKTIADRVLEFQMEDATCRDDVIELLENMLRKKYIVIL